MESGYIKFKRPDGTIFNKLPSISAEAVAAYQTDGCVRIEIESPKPAEPRQAKGDRRGSAAASKARRRVGKKNS